MGEGGPQDGFAALAQADPWAPVSTDGLPRALVAAVEAGDWKTARVELEQVMDGLSTDGPYGRALLQLVRRVPIGLDPVFDRYRAAIAIDHGDWDDLRHCLEAAPYAARELEQFKETLLASINRLRARPTASPDDVPFAAYEFQLTGRSGWYRHWARSLPSFDASSRFSRPDLPVGRHFRYRALHHTVHMAFGEAQAGSLLTATALAREGQRLGDEGEPLRDIAADLETLTLLAMGDAPRGRTLLFAERATTSRGMSPLGTFEVLLHVMPLLALMPEGWLSAAAMLLQRIATRMGSPKAQLLAKSWAAAAEAGAATRRSELPAVMSAARHADPGLQVLPQLLAARASRRYADFQASEQLARRVGNVWAQVSSLAWMTALDPSPRVGRHLYRLLELTGWRRPVLVPEPIVMDAVVGLMAIGLRGRTLVEMGLAGRPSTATDIASRHALDLSLPPSMRLVGVEALLRIGTIHSRQILGLLARTPDEVGAAARASERTARSAGLTDREVQVLELAGQGLTNKQIANRLVLSHHTVARHLSNSRDKLGAANRADAAVRLGRLSLELEGHSSADAIGRDRLGVSIPYRATTIGKVPPRQRRLTS